MKIQTDSQTVLYFKFLCNYLLTDAPKSLNKIPNPSGHQHFILLQIEYYLLWAIDYIKWNCIFENKCIKCLVWQLHMYLLFSPCQIIIFFQFIFIMFLLFLWCLWLHYKNFITIAIYIWKYEWNKKNSLRKRYFYFPEMAQVNFLRLTISLWSIFKVRQSLHSITPIFVRVYPS